MNCRNCGAAMQAVGGRAYFRCTYCGAFEFPEATDTGITKLSEASPYPCPICIKTLSKASLHGYPIFYCSHCRGFLTTNADFTRILHARRQEQTNESSIVQPLSKEDLRRRVNCPGCKNRMDTHPYGGGGNVVVDTCHRCHLIWFDAGEFETLARYQPVGKTRDSRLAELLPIERGPSKEPVSNFRWGWENSNYEENTASSSLFWDTLKRLF